MIESKNLRYFSACFTTKLSFSSNASLASPSIHFFFFLNDPAPTKISPLPLHDALPISMKISKSKFIAGVQCPKRLYLLVHAREMAAQPDGSDRAIIEQGREVGLLARQLFPGGVEVHVDRKSTRLNSSHSQISYAVFCLK